MAFLYQYAFIKAGASFGWTEGLNAHCWSNIVMTYFLDELSLAAARQVYSNCLKNLTF